MAPYHIRRYQDHDWEPVRELFSQGLLGNMPSDFRHLLKKPRTFLIILGVPFALFLGSGSLVLCLLSLLGLLAGHWLTFRHCIIQYIDKSLHNDLLDIQKSYLSGRGSSFWVAESEYQVVGIVGARPASGPIGGRNYLELRRLSVKRTYRGKGMARTLIQTVLQFARDEGYDGVVLGTPNSYHPAQRLYESLGFWKYHESGYYLNWWLGFFSVWHYQCDFSSQK
ncbi:N-acetyltransferase 8-like [Vombatus ursinus]|uniref:N-acetyltransferase 8-like n=1 Tax=Vombatus ursinus TaxID=29139 RepID=UPI000FFD635A|nr:N-acetyltransferase 8-like [Vombatus ursinus]